MSAGWVVLKTQPQREVLAAGALRVRGVESFAPYLVGRRGTRAVPLFPGYIFARVALYSDDLLRIRSAPGVAYMLPRAAPPLLIPDAVVESLRVRTTDPSLIQRPLRQGDRVKVESGPFRWMEAVFDRRLNAAGRVRILLSLVHRTIAVSIEEGYLERVGAS